MYLSWLYPQWLRKTILIFRHVLGLLDVEQLGPGAEDRLPRFSALSSATETDDNDDVDETETEDHYVPEVLFSSNKGRVVLRRRKTVEGANQGLASGRSCPSFVGGTTYLYSGGLTPATTCSSAVQLEAEKPLSQRMDAFKTRTVWTGILVISFLVILAAGPFYTSLLVLGLTVLVYREVIALKRNIEKDKKLPLFFVLRWYWFVLTIYGTGYSWLLPLADGLQIPQYRWLQVLVSHHLIITYFSAFMGLILFILSLRRFSLRYQFSQFALLLLTCLFVVGQSMFQIANIYDGLIWFFISSSSVIINDIFAYIFGIFFGRTRLIKLSPKKTVEGFLGASIVTLIWSICLSEFLSRYEVFVCPQQTVSFRPFAHWSNAHCDVHHVFKPRDMPLSGYLAGFLGYTSITAKPAVLHCFVLGIFAAFFAPFGGFFASALKRALRIKDFGVSIPGHGGITDRFDCQLIMGMFTFLYVRTFVFRNAQRPSFVSILHLVETLSAEDKMRLLKVLQLEDGAA